MGTIVVTGGAGFIGSHLVDEYLKRGYEVVVIDNLSTGTMKNLRNATKYDTFHFYQVDIQDMNAMKQVFEKYRPTIINHHAAQKSIPMSIEDPVYDMRINGIGLLNLIVLAKKYAIQNFIYVSSGGALSKEIIGDEKSKETDWPQQQSSYAITKFAGENYIRMYAKLYGFDYTILRYANVYGPRQTMDGECGVVPIFINNILHDRSSILMTYEDMPEGCTRDYIFVGDVVDINMRVTTYCLNDTINIGSGREITIMDIYRTIERVYGKNIEIQVKGPRIGDVRRSVLDYSRAKKRTGWEPKTTFEEGIKIIYSHTTG